MQTFGLSSKIQSDFTEEFQKMQRLLESNKFEQINLMPSNISVTQLIESFSWGNWLNFEGEYRCFLEKQTLDLNTTTQTTSRNNESLTTKKRDSELIGVSFKRGSKIGEMELNSIGREIINGGSAISQLSMDLGGRHREKISGKNFKNISEVRVVKGLVTPKEFLKNLVMKKDKDSRPFNKGDRGFNKSTHDNRECLGRDRVKEEVSAIPNNTISSENEEISNLAITDNPSYPTSENKSNLNDQRDLGVTQGKISNSNSSSDSILKWNGMKNSISDLQDIQDLKNSSDLSDHTLNDNRKPSESDSEQKDGKRCIFIQGIETDNSHLQTPEFGESSQGYGFYKPHYPVHNSSKILYDLYEETDNSYQIKDLIHQNFNKKNENQDNQEDNQHNVDVPSSGDAKDASGPHQIRSKE